MRWLLSQDLDPLFWRAGRLGVESAWYAHVPFAHWLVAVTRPRLLVELGTRNGVSYSAFCEAVVNGKLDTRCFAVDTWKGDDHSGFYPEEVYLIFAASTRSATALSLNFFAADLTKPSRTSPIPQLIFCTLMVCPPTRRCAVILKAGGQSCPKPQWSFFIARTSDKGTLPFGAFGENCVRNFPRSNFCMVKALVFSPWDVQRLGTYTSFARCAILQRSRQSVSDSHY